MDINLPEVMEEMLAVFSIYERALVGNDLVVLDDLFWDDPRVVRFGVGEALFGIEEIRAFRLGRSPQGLARRIERTMITTFGQDFATTSLMFTREGTPGRLGRQQQSWARLPHGWKIVAAHVSVIGASG